MKNTSLNQIKIRLYPNKIIIEAKTSELINDMVENHLEALRICYREEKISWNDHR